ncbi:MAG: LysE family transporter [Bacteroidota bacterium]
MNGLFFGLIFIFILGPAFFALIQSSLQQGFRKAIFLAIGVSVSDTIYVMVVLFGLAALLDGEEFRFWVALGGVVLLIAYAIYSWLKQPKIFNEKEKNQDGSYLRNFIKGLLLNGLNPLVIVFWATWISNITVRFEYDFAAQMQFFLGMLAMILGLDIAKAFIAHRLKHLITIRFIKRMNRAVAIVLILFSGQLIYYLIENYT